MCFLDPFAWTAWLKATFCCPYGKIPIWINSNFENVARAFFSSSRNPIIDLLRVWLFLTEHMLISGWLVLRVIEILTFEKNKEWQSKSSPSIFINWTRGEIKKKRQMIYQELMTIKMRIPCIFFPHGKFIVRGKMRARRYWYDGKYLSLFCFL